MATKLPENYKVTDLGYDKLLRKPDSFYDQGHIKDYASNVIAPVLKGGVMEMGSIDDVMKFEEQQGLWLGHSSFSSAPFRVNMSGAVVANNITASGYNRIYKQAGIPTADNKGDLWIDTDNGNKNYRAASAGSDEITAGEWEEVTTEWGGVQDDGNKPADNATLGATFGSDIAGGGSSNNQVSNTGYSTRYLRQLFGDASDGSATISSNTALSDDTYYNDLTIDASYRLNTNGYRLFVQGTLTVNGELSFDGLQGGHGPTGSNGKSSSSGGQTSGGSGATALPGNYLTGGIAGEDGGTGGGGSSDPDGGTGGGVGTDTTSVSNALGSAANNGGLGGNGGDALGGGSSGGGGGGGTGGTITVADTEPRHVVGAYHMIDFSDLADIQKYTTSSSAPGGGGGGGGGAEDTTYGGSGGGGGGGGTPGGTMVVFARNIVVGNAGEIHANGGNGGNGGAGGDGYSGGTASGGGGGGGGCGGNGGTLISIYNSLTNNGTIEVASGTGGTGGSGGTGYGMSDGETGNNGENGDNGLIIQMEV